MDAHANEVSTGSRSDRVASLAAPITADDLDVLKG